MKAIMSETLREILRDPRSNKELEKGISKLSSHSDKRNESTVISIGKHNYEIRFIEAEPQTKK